MATRRWLWLCVVVLQFPTFVHSITCESKSKIGEGNGKKWANELAVKLETFFSGVIPYETLKQQYKNSTRVTYRNVDGKKLVQDMGKDLSKFLGRKVKALWNATREAEEIAKNYKWNEKLKHVVHLNGYYGKVLYNESKWCSWEEECGSDNSSEVMAINPRGQIDSVEYVNSKLLKRGDPMLVYDPMFKQAVNPNISSVHIPVEIYEGKIDILNGLNWTAGLDRVFKANRDRDPDLLWMFFGSQTGFMRTMPASRWKCNGEVDLYDVRRRPWYTQGSSSPKDMLILIDASGSVHGQALQLIKVAVQSLLDTLGDNDFFNILKFSSEASYVHDCFNHTFVQANYRNKRILQEKVGELKAEGKADFRVGLTFAFEQFIRFRGNDSQNHGANCNEVIMLLTDGGSDKAKEVFEKYNWPNNKSVRVFTYTIGSTSDPTESIRWMACANRGFYSPIPAMGAIRSKVQEYVPVLSRPMGLQNAKHVSWGNIRYNNMGLGMLTTVTLPVYNRSESSNNQTILGVMGVDVATSRIMDYYPKQKLTPNGYSFAINQNGYIIFHPDLKAQYGWLQDPPNVDFLDIEYETEEKVQLRRKMIDGESGEQRIKTMLVQADERHVVEVNRTYFFTSINNSDFSLGIVIPDYAQLYPEVTENYTEEKGFQLLGQNKTAMLISMSEYYPGYGKEDVGQMTGTIQDLLKVKGTVEFDQDLLQLLFWDADVTKNVADYFSLMKGRNENSCSGDGVIAAFVGTNSGLTRVNWCQDNETNTVEQMLGERDVWRRPYYKRALEKDGYVFSAEPLKTDPTAAVNVGAESNDTVIPDVMMVRAITIEPDGKNGKIFKPAVTGVKIKHSRLLKMMELGSTSCEDSMMEARYLLDDGGFVIATSVEDHFDKVGKFFGDVDCPVMSALYNESSTHNTQIYSREIRVDHQASCPDQPEKASFAGLRSIRVPTLAMLSELLSFDFWSSQLTWAYFNFNIYNWLFTPSYAYGADEVSDGMDDEGADSDCSPISDDTSSNHSCTKIEAHYYFRPDVPVMSGSIYCGNCTKDFVASKVPNTNLLLVVADIIEPECEDQCAFCDIMQAPREEDDPDNCLLNKRYRRRPVGCYSEDENEDDSKCGSVYPLPSSFFILLVVIGTLILSGTLVGADT